MFPSLRDHMFPSQWARLCSVLYLHLAASQCQSPQVGGQQRHRLAALRLVASQYQAPQVGGQLQLRRAASQCQAPQVGEELRLRLAASQCQAPQVAQPAPCVEPAASQANRVLQDILLESQ